MPGQGGSTTHSQDLVYGVSRDLVEAFRSFVVRRQNGRRLSNSKRSTTQGYNQTMSDGTIFGSLEIDGKIMKAEAVALYKHQTQKVRWSFVVYLNKKKQTLQFCRYPHIKETDESDTGSDESDGDINKETAVNICLVNILPDMEIHAVPPRSLNIIYNDEITGRHQLLLGLQSQPDRDELQNQLQMVVKDAADRQKTYAEKSAAAEQAISATNAAIKQAGGDSLSPSSSSNSSMDVTQ